MTLKNPSQISSTNSSSSSVDPTKSSIEKSLIIKNSSLNPFPNWLQHLIKVDDLIWIMHIAAAPSFSISLSLTCLQTFLFIVNLKMRHVVCAYVTRNARHVLCVHNNRINRIVMSAKSPCILHRHFFLLLCVAFLTLNNRERRRQFDMPINDWMLQFFWVIFLGLWEIFGGGWQWRKIYTLEIY